MKLKEGDVIKLTEKEATRLRSIQSESVSMQEIVSKLLEGLVKKEGTLMIKRQDWWKVIRKKYCIPEEKDLIEQGLTMVADSETKEIILVKRKGEL